MAPSDFYLAIVIEINRYSTKMSKKDVKHKKFLNILCIVYI